MGKDMIEFELDGYPVVNYWRKDQPWRQGNRSHLRRAMYALHKNCYFCNIEMVFEPRPEPQKQPHNLATIDHLISLPNRGKGAVVPKVLSCYSCNAKRSKGQNPNRKKHKAVQ